MNRFLQKARSAAAWGWRRAAAGVALVLIVLALFVGYWMGSPSREAGSAVASGADAAEPTMYTCSMHPSVRLPDPDAKCPICSMDLIPVGEESTGNENRLVLSEAAAATSRVETSRVARFFPAATVRLYGKIEYDETSVARLTAYAPGRIERLFVNYVGVPVRRGDHLGELYSPELLAAFEELRQAARSLGSAGDASELVRDTARDTLAAAREKLRLLGVTPEQIERVEAGEFEGDRLTIYAPLGGVVTHLAVREGDYVDTGDPIATVADLSRLWLDLEAYESQLPLLRWGQPVTFTVEARPGETFAGRVAFIEPMVNERTRTAVVRVAVDNADRRLKPGMFASATARPRVAESGAVLSDELAGKWVSPMHPTVVKDAPGSCDVCGMDLVPAESLGVVGGPGDAREPLVVPRTAVLFTGVRSLVYVQIPDAETPTYEPREITLGSHAGEFYVVRDGLGEGERVVTRGAFRIDSVMQIAGKPSMMGASRTSETERRTAGTPDAFIYSLKPVYAAYLDAHETLADDDLAGYRRAAGDLGTAIALVEDAALTGEPLGAWRRAAASLRLDPDAPDLEDARARFQDASRGVIDLLERFGHYGSQPWRLAHCPMAFESAGADWVQRGETIDNPYFGASMLRCGSIERVFEPLGEAGDE